MRTRGYKLEPHRSEASLIMLHNVAPSEASLRGRQFYYRSDTVLTASLGVQGIENNVASGNPVMRSLTLVNRHPNNRVAHVVDSDIKLKL